MGLNLSQFQVNFAFNFPWAGPGGLDAVSETCPSFWKSKTFDEEWSILQEAINRIGDSLERNQEIQFSPEEYMRAYSAGYDIHWAKDNTNRRRLYENSQKAIENYILSKVLPSLRQKEGHSFLPELVKRWDDHKIMTRWLSRFIKLESRSGEIKIPSLEETSHLTFHNLVCGELNARVRDLVISLIDKEHKGEEIDQAIVENVLKIYLEMGEIPKMYYERVFKEALLKSATTFCIRIIEELG